MWQFWIDRGGTFTDIVGRAPDGRLHTSKLLSAQAPGGQDPALSGIRSLLGLRADEAVPADRVHSVKMGTTIATNALLQRRGEPTLLVVNRGFADMLLIGDQTRPRLFDLDIVRAAPLYTRVIELAGRFSAAGDELEAVDEAEARQAFAGALAGGIGACAIAMLHAWRHTGHETRLAEIAREAGFAQVSVSHEASPLPRFVPRAETTVVDAYLSPVLGRYVDAVAAALGDVPLYFMQSSGGLARGHAFHGKDAILSGPAGGIVGAARTAERDGFARVITFDMGGTSTDVALYDGAFERTNETTVAGIRVRTPMMAINTVAAGGGSRLFFDAGAMRVGPDSAGADPGPACYRRGGGLTLTDANLLLGRIRPAHFPAIFGPAGDEALDAAVVVAGFAELAARISRETGGDRDPCDVADGFVRIAVANMAQAIKRVSTDKGQDPAGFVLQCFGGAGGQHACLVADELGMRTVIVHPFAGVLSAFGMGLADQSVLREQAVERPLSQDALPGLRHMSAGLAREASAALAEQGADASVASIRSSLKLRSDGTEAALPVELGALDAMVQAFASAHLARFGFAAPSRTLIVESIAVECVVAGASPDRRALAGRHTGSPVAVELVRLFSGGDPYHAPVFDRESLLAGDRLDGPALIREANATTILDCGWSADVKSSGTLLLHRRGVPATIADATEGPADPGLLKQDGPADPVLLELFGKQFMHIAEQMGIILRRTAMSVNIRERLDFSCAIFDAEGALIANAPHVPVHLGAMGESVRCVLRARHATLRAGDSVALNNPYAGGTHLPDITVITPVFSSSNCSRSEELRFFVASRAHHADIGGTAPGSTPPDSRRLEDEGVVIDDFLIVSAGVFREAEFRALLAGGPHPARNPDMNVADIKAQLAANAAGAAELLAVIERKGWPAVRAYMGHVMDHAAERVRRVIDRLPDGMFDYRMDDGAALRVRVTVDRAARTACVDFTGTDAQRDGNFNAPLAVTRAAVLYVFRCLVGEDIPLNDGCLVPLRIVVPPGTFLSPREGAAVVAGNTEVSQAVTNALFGALGVLACSQATMNNFLYGNLHMQYYETICGGAGAGPGWHGASAVHTHMTNTRMTDPEMLELHYPVRLEGFGVRANSGGDGRTRGGNGAWRRTRFLEAMTAVIVASRRTVAPFGLQGGLPGEVGRQWVQRKDGTVVTLAGTDRTEIQAGDLFVVETPGGGGFGPPA